MALKALGRRPRPINFHQATALETAADAATRARHARSARNEAVAAALAAGVTQQAVADATGLSVSLVGKIGRGDVE